MNSTTDLIGLALEEDLGSGDVTVLYFTDPDAQACARIFAKEACVAAGIQVAQEVFRRIDARLRVECLAGDGDRIEAGQSVMTISGAKASVLSGERTALNFLQRLSGIATTTRRYVDLIRATSARILDTRKTTPGLRQFEKAAVRAGGGTNHRFGLHDMVMVKDNHLAGSLDLGRLQAGIRRAKEERPGIRVELEADTLDQARDFLQLEGVDVILLDNMPVADLATAVAMRRGAVQFEASGGITLENVRAVAETGVDFISIGALTHSAGAVDFSLEIE